MSTSEATEAAKRKFAHQHPDWADEHPHSSQPHKHHTAPTTHTTHNVVAVCNLTGLKAVCEHKENGERHAVKEKEEPQAAGRAVKEPTQAKAEAGRKAEAGKQEGTFVLSVIPHGEPAKLHWIPQGTPPVVHNEKSVGYQGSDPFHTIEHENAANADKREAEKKQLDRELQELHDKKAGLRTHGANLLGERAQIEQYAHKLEKKREALDQKSSHSQVNGNLGKRKAQAIHKQRLQHQQDQAALNRKKAHNAQAMADHEHKQAQNAKDISHFQKENAAHVRFNLQLYTEHGKLSDVDVITLTAEMSQHCQEHPVWKVFDAQTHKLLASHNGMTLQCNNLLAPVVKETVLSRLVPHLPQHGDAYWVRNIHPHTYKIQLETCYAEKEILIHVYPQIKSGLALTINRERGHMPAPDDSWLGRIEKYEEKFKKILNLLERFAPNLENVDIDILAQGKLNLSNTWEEEPHSDEVVWKAKVDADLDLIEASFRIPIASIDPLPQAFKDKIGNFVDAGIFFTFDGKVGAGFAGAWTDKEGFRMEEGSISGNFALGVEGLIAFGKDGKWGRLEATGTSTISVGAKVKGAEKVLLLELSWQFVHPFTAEFSLFGPFDTKWYEWKHDLWNPGLPHALAPLHLFEIGG